MKNLLIIIGPTAIGKTSYAIKKALELNGEIISADSMQIYRRMDIGTAKPTREEQARVPHHMIDIVDPDEEFSVAQFIQEFKKIRAAVEARNKTPIMVGGTGLYINALLKGFGLPLLPSQPHIRQRLRQEANEHGGQILHERLSAVDPITAARLHPNDHFRIIRALEVAMVTGKPMSVQQKQGEPILGQNYQLQCLTAAREIIYERINKRVDSMIGEGLVEEVQNLLAMGYNKNLMSMKALGYKETIDYLEGKMKREELIELIKKKTRNFAKRQLTWFRSFKNAEWLEISSL